MRHFPTIEKCKVGYLRMYIKVHNYVSQENNNKENKSGLGNPFY